MRSARAPLPRLRAAASAISPAPSRSTAWSDRSPKIRPARSTATLEMLTVPAPIAVSVRTRLATANARVTQRASVPLSAPAATAAS